MDVGFIVLAAIAAIATIGLVLLQMRATRISGELINKTSEAAELVARHATEISEIRESVVRLKTQFEGAQQTIDELNSTIARLEAEKSRLETAQNEIEKREALALQKVEESERRMEDWEAAKKQNIEAAKAATLESARHLSSKLLEDHKREAEEVKKSGEEEVEKTAEKLKKEFTEVVKSVASLNDQVNKNHDTLGTVWNALTNPAGVGYYSEISLENTLKSFGLQPDLDFYMRRKMAESDSGGKLIPDAVVFLPGSSLLVIDSKASKFFLELAEATGGDDEDAAYEKLANSMRLHLRGLAGKDYQTAIKKDYQQSGRGDEVARILSVMYLPNEAALEKLNHADPDFSKRAADARIIPAGPVSLSAIIGFASAEIDLGRQAANQEKIVTAVQSLLEAFEVAMRAADKTGNSIKSAAENYKKLAGSINSRLLPRAQALVKLGVKPASNKDLPRALKSYQVVASDAPDVIEGEARDISGADRLEDQSDGQD
jgi:DNA recombination protein RmuC